MREKICTIVLLVLVGLCFGAVWNQQRMRPRSTGFTYAMFLRSYGYIDSQGKTVILPQFNTGDNFSDGLAAVRVPKSSTDRRYEPNAYVDIVGHIVKTRNAHREANPEARLFKIRIGNKFGYQERDGSLVIPAVWDYAEDFVDNVALVGNYHAQPFFQENMLINRHGDIIFKFKDLHFLGSFHEGLLEGSVHNYSGYVDTKGKFVIQPQFKLAGPFSEGRASVCPLDYKKSGVINMSGNFLTQPKFDWIGHFSEGLAAYRIGSEKGYIDRFGNVIFSLPPDANYLGEFHEGLAEVFIGGSSTKFDDDWQARDDAKGGFIDKTGKFVIKPQFSAAGLLVCQNGFHEGLAAVGIGYGEEERFGYIDHSGKYVIQPKYLAAMQFSEGLACVCFDHKLDPRDIKACEPRRE